MTWWRGSPSYGNQHVILGVAVTCVTGTQISVRSRMISSTLIIHRTIPLSFRGRIHRICCILGAEFASGCFCTVLSSKPWTKSQLDSSKTPQSCRLHRSLSLSRSLSLWAQREMGWWWIAVNGVILCCALCPVSSPFNPKRWEASGKQKVNSRWQKLLPSFAAHGFCLVGPRNVGKPINALLLSSIKLFMVSERIQSKLSVLKWIQMSRDKTCTVHMLLPPVSNANCFQTSIPWT